MYFKTDYLLLAIIRRRPYLYRRYCSAKVIQPALPVTYPSDNTYIKYARAKYQSSEELTTPTKCQIIGEIPDWIEGTFMRVGPGKFEYGKNEAKHFFDGDALAHSFTIKNGEVVYRSRFLETDYHRKNKKYNRYTAAGFGTWAPPDPCADIFKRLALYFIPTRSSDNTNVNIFNLQGRIVAATEAPWMTEIDPVTLETIKKVNASNQLDSDMRNWLAHPHYDTNGDLYIFSTKLKPPITIQLIKFPAKMNTQNPAGEIIAELPCETGNNKAGYYHSFAMTENYIILIENPLYIKSIAALFTMNITRTPISELLKWNPDVGLKFRIICRHTFKEVRSCKAESSFIFHHANAFEENGEIIIDACAYEDDAIIKLFYTKNITKAFQGMTFKPPNLHRYKIPIKEIQEKNKESYQLTKSKQGKDFEVLAGNIETPMYNYNKVNGKKYKYVYGMENLLHSNLLKVNVETKDVLYWKAPENFSASEPYFIAHPNSNEEDDGVVVSTVTGCNDEKSFLLVLNAKTFEEMGRAQLPIHMALMIHGYFMNNSHPSMN